MDEDKHSEREHLRRVQAIAAVLTIAEMSLLAIRENGAGMAASGPLRGPEWQRYAKEASNGQ